MPPEDTGTGTPPTEQPQAPQTPPAAPAGTPAPGAQLTPPSAPRAPRLEPDADLERVTRLYHNLTGQLNAYIAQTEQYTGGLQQRLATAEQAVQTSASRMGTLEAERSRLTGEVASLPELQQRASEVDTLQEQLEKLHLLMGYPAIVNRVEERQVQQEGQEEPTTVRANPTLELLLSSSLSGSAFAEQVDAFARGLGSGPEGPRPPAQAAELGTTVPPTPSPDGSFDPWARYNELYSAGKFDEAAVALSEDMQRGG